MGNAIYRHFLVQGLVNGSLLFALAPCIAAAQDISKRPTESIGQSLATAPTRDLSLADTITFQIPPPTALLSQTKCDQKGNIYLVESGAPPNLLVTGGLSSVPVTKLSIDSKAAVSFPVPMIGRYRGAIRSDFDVDADGNLFALLQALDASPADSRRPPSYFIAKYRTDGSLDSHHELDVAARHLQPFRFAVFGNGNVLLTGTTAIDGEPLRPFISVFNKDGRFVADVKVKHTKSPATATAATEDERANSESNWAVGLSSSSMMASGPDGNVYLLRDATQPRIYAISPAGEVIRSLEVHLPIPTLTASKLAVTSDGKIAITFSHVEGISAPAATNADIPNDLISILSSQTGEVSAVYRLPAETAAFSMPACAVSSNSFLFVGMTADRQHQQVAEYSAQK